MDIHIQGFRCWKKFCQSFPDGISLLAGKSGCGKSSILDAISWAMYGKVAKIAPRVCPGAKTVVRISFQGWTIERCRKPNRLTVKIHRGDDVEEYTASSAQSEIEKAFGSYSTWLSTCYISQGNMVELLSITSGDRMRVLEELFYKGDIDKRDKCITRMKKDMLEISDKSKDIAARISALEYKLSALVGIHGDSWSSVEYAKARQICPDKVESLILRRKSLEELVDSYYAIAEKLEKLEASRKGEISEINRISGTPSEPISLSQEYVYFTKGNGDLPSFSIKVLLNHKKLVAESLGTLQRMREISCRGTNSVPTMRISPEIVKDCKEKDRVVNEALGKMNRYGLTTEEYIQKRIDDLNNYLQKMDSLMAERRRRQLLEHRLHILSKIKSAKEPIAPQKPFDKTYAESIREKIINVRKAASADILELSKIREKISIGETAMSCPECGTNLVAIDSQLSVFKI